MYAVMITSSQGEIWCVYYIIYWDTILLLLFVSKVGMEHTNLTKKCAYGHSTLGISSIFHSFDVEISTPLPLFIMPTTNLIMRMRQHSG